MNVVIKNVLQIYSLLLFQSTSSFFTVNLDIKTFLFDETHLALVRGLIHEEVSPKCVKEESSTERRSYNRQVNRSPQL